MTGAGGDGLRNEFKHASLQISWNCRPGTNWHGYRWAKSWNRPWCSVSRSCFRMFYEDFKRFLNHSMVIQWCTPHRGAVSQIEGRTQEILLESLGGCQRQASATFGADIMPTHRSNESLNQSFPSSFPWSLTPARAPHLSAWLKKS